MEQKHRKAIQSNFKSLVETTDLDSVVTALYEKGVFSEQMIEPYRDNSESPRERKRKLYSEITRRGPRAFANLVETLSELGYWQLVRELDPTDPLSMMSRPSNSSIIPNTLPRLNEEFLSLNLEKRKSKNEQQKNSSVSPPPDNANALPPLDLDNDTNAMFDDTKLEVTKSTKFKEDNDNNDVKLYRTRGRQRGVVFMFSYVCFQNNIENYRHGVEVDCERLKHLFIEFGFKVLSYVNLEYEATVNTLKSVETVLGQSSTECVFVVVSSHGYGRPGTNDTDIRCSDGRLISFYEIMTHFSNRALPQLYGIPKVFIFQVCRGSSEEYVLVQAAAPPQMKMPEGEVVTDGTPSAPHARAPRPPSPSLHKVALYSDILIAHSTLPGSVSYRNHAQGSWYIQVLCEVFSRRAHDTHVDKLFTMVDQRLHDKFSIQTSSVDRWGFNKRLYLHPGLYE